MMNKTVEILTFLIGLALIYVNIFIIKIPPTFRRVNLLEGYFFKGIILIIGITLILFSIISLLSKESLLKNKKVKRRIANIILLTVTLIVCLGIIELTLQLTSPKNCGQRDELLHHSYAANCSSSFKTHEWDIISGTNSHGLRDDEIHLGDISGNYTYRILALGDSFTLGYGVEKEESFPEVLEKKLQEKLQVEVINSGVTSYSPILEYLYLRERGLKFKPDMVILNFDMSDLQNDYEYEKLASFDENGYLVGIPSTNQNFLETAYQKIKIIKFLESPLVALDSRISGDRYVTRISSSSHFYDIKYDKYALTRENYKPSSDKEHWERTFKYIELINKLCVSNDIKLVLVTYPYGHQVSGEEWSAGRHNFGFEKGKVYSDKPNDILKKFAQEKEIEFINLFEGFKESEEFPLFFAYDGHFNKQGHQLAAEIIFKEMETRGMLNDYHNNETKNNGTNEVGENSGKIMGGSEKSNYLFAKGIENNIYHLIISKGENE